jgi:hypothetical protein
MVNSRKRIVTIKFTDEEMNQLVKGKERWHFENNSDFIRSATLEKLNSSPISNIAGKNIIEYNSINDSFVWKIRLDDGQEKIILENLSLDFIQNLANNINFQINKRNEFLGKKHKHSIAVPKRLVE